MRQPVIAACLALILTWSVNAQTRVPEPFSTPTTRKTVTPPTQAPAPQPAPRTGPGIAIPRQNDPFPAPSRLGAETAQGAPVGEAKVPALQTEQERRMREIALRFAPVIHHRQAGSAEEHRFDFPTLFDFDGDWTGNNNWEHAADPKYRLYAYVYYSVLETEDYYFLHYALFHPRDWSVVQSTYGSVLDTLQQKIGEIFTSRTREEVEFNHENDLEGILVMVRKEGAGPRAVAMETVAHNRLLRYVAEDSGLEVPASRLKGRLVTEDGRPVIYVESQKHGIHGYGGERSTTGDPIVVFRPGAASEYGPSQGGEATYDLAPIHLTFWPRAQEAREPNLTYGTVTDFGETFCTAGGAHRPGCVIGRIGDALRGDYARPNSAHAPWGWSDMDDPRLTPGAWFFDPVQILRRHFGQFDLEQKYLYNPYLGIAEAAAEEKP
jgi:hypothetical protein